MVRIPLPVTVAEIRLWGDLGLIKPVDNLTLIDEGIAEVFARIRRHIEVGEAGWDDERKARMGQPVHNPSREEYERCRDRETHWERGGYCLECGFVASEFVTVL